MKLLVPTLIAINSVTAMAMDKGQARDKIEQSYYSDFFHETISANWSLYGCRTQEIQITGKDPVTLKDRKIMISQYQPRKKANGSAVIILPPTGGVNLLDKGYANELCSKGITVVIVSGWAHQNETSLSYEMHNNGALRALAATRHVVEFLSLSNYESIGLLGTSIGAIAGSLALGFEPRIKMAAFIVGSALFPEVIAGSDEKGAKELRKARIEAFGYKNSLEYEMAVKENVWVRPSDYLENAGDTRTLVVTADSDTTVSTEDQERLVAMLNPVEHIRRSGDHLKVIKDAFRFNRKDIVNFFLNSKEL